MDSGVSNSRMQKAHRQAPEGFVIAIMNNPLGFDIFDFLICIYCAAVVVDAEVHRSACKPRLGAQEVELGINDPFV